MDKLTNDAVQACEQYGAYTVRKAAREFIDAWADLDALADLEAKEAANINILPLVRRMGKAINGLENMGLGDYCNEENNILAISTIAFDRMKGREIFDERGYKGDLTNHPCAEMTGEEVSKIKLL